MMRHHPSVRRAFEWKLGAAAILVVSAAACATGPASQSGAPAGGEGMWTPAQLPALADDLRRAGLEIDPETLADLSAPPLNAVISLGGCTASF
ncbi:MAG: S46 family peptidase, partial [Maricaulaceae bacterium]